MNEPQYKSAGIGAVIALVACILCLLLDNGKSESVWIYLPFLPGIAMCLLATVCGAPLWICYTVGFLTMALFGALFGAMIGYGIARRRCVL